MFRVRCYSAIVALVLLFTFPVHSYAQTTWVIPTVAETSAYGITRSGCRYVVPAVGTALVPRTAALVGGQFLRNSLAILGPIGVVATLGITGYEIYKAVKEDPGKYPGMAPSAGAQAPLAGSRVTAPNGVVYQFGECVTGPPSGGWIPAPGDPWRYEAGIYVWGHGQAANGGFIYVDQWPITPVTNGAAPTPIPNPVPQSDFERGITDAYGKIRPDLMNDLDKLIKANPSVITVSPSPADVYNTYNDYTNTYDTTSNYNTNTKNLMSTLTNNYNQAAADAAANPADAAKQAAAKEAKAKLDQYNMEQSRREMEDAAKLKQQAEDAKAAENMPKSTPDAPHSLDFTPFARLQGVLAAAWPFNLLSGLAGMIGDLVREPAAPVYDLPMPFETVIHVDLTPFNPLAAICRWAIGLLLTIGAALGINNFFRGVS